MIALPPPASTSLLRSSSTIALSIRKLRSFVPVGIAVVRPEVRSCAEGPASNSRIAAANTASASRAPTGRGTSCKVLRAPSARTKYTETVARAGRSNHQTASKMTATTTATLTTPRRTVIGAPGIGGYGYGSEFYAACSGGNRFRTPPLGGDASIPASHCGDNGDFRFLPQGGGKPLQKPHILVVDEDVHETVDLAIRTHDTSFDSWETPLQIHHQVRQRGPACLDHALISRQFSQRRRNSNSRHSNPPCPPLGLRLRRRGHCARNPSVSLGC